MRAAISDSGPTVCSHGRSLAAASGIQQPGCPRANRPVLRGGGRRQSRARNGDQVVGEVSAFRHYLLQTSLCRAAGHDRRIPPRGRPGAEQAGSRAGKTTHTLQSTAPKERSHWTKKKKKKKKKEEFPSCPTEGYLTFHYTCQVEDRVESHALVNGFCSILHMSHIQLFIQCNSSRENSHAHHGGCRVAGYMLAT